MKKKYVEPDMQIVLFDAEDVITASIDNDVPYVFNVNEEILKG